LKDNFILTLRYGNSGKQKYIRMKSKKTLAFKSLLIAMLLYLITGIVSACEISFAVEGKEKAKYEIGEIVIIKVTIELTHNNCPVALKDTKIQGSGIEIVGATEWKNPTDSKWERKVKVKIISTKEGKATITAKRTCEKDGGWGTFTLKATPTK
jgi:hypothetical protein